MGDSSHIFEDHDNLDEAEQLLAMCLGVDPDELDDDYEPPKRTRERYLSLVARRAGGEPLPFLTGHIEFYGLDLAVRPGAFVPRPSSELIVERSLKALRRKREPVVVDVCAGAGPIALAIADERPDAEVWGADISEEGIKQARMNARRLGIDNAKFKVGDMYEPLPRRLMSHVDVIVGHVPYVPADELDDLPAEVREFEPAYTLTDASDGTYLMERAIVEGLDRLKPGGRMLLEVAPDLSRMVKRLFRKSGFGDLEVGSDDDDLTITVEGRKPL
ncbi:MAG: release factor glutamine methyltransferase [Actinomycetota bacterium]|nr:release factor glutamine methyltransferase [Actinomycetota bacterium]